jgi:predicted fused transcriptional regulator/phosphomethylpyrimidine kinase
VPPVFYESRGWGKEPLFFLVGPDPAGVATRAIEIAKGLASWQE